MRYANGAPKALHTDELAEGHALLCAAIPEGDIRVRIEEVDPGGLIQVRTLPCRVTGKRQLTHDVVTLQRTLASGERLRFRAGHVLRDGRRRAFSLANPPHRDDALELHVRKVPEGSFSSYVFDGMPTRALLRLQSPLGNFFLQKDLKRSGIGTASARVRASHCRPETQSLLYRTLPRLDTIARCIASAPASHGFPLRP